MFRKILPVLLLSAALLGLAGAQSHTLMSYNIRYDIRNPLDPDTWEKRREFLVSQLQFSEPDVLGIQEGLHHQVEYLDSLLPEYSYAGVGRDDGAGAGEYSAVFYRKDRYRLLRTSTFWLSEDPGRPSVGWDASMERICTWILLEEIRSEQSFWVFNTHFDHIGTEARKNSSRLIIAKITQLNTESYPVVLMGDLNLTPDQEPIEYISGHLADSRHTAEFMFGPEGTFNGFEHDHPAERRIDYIFTDSSRVRVRKYAVLNESRNGRYPSDHFPVLAEIEFRKKRPK
jgi:endonuclease/exonuclease/phosphatase family metal-dependent hydrolase